MISRLESTLRWSLLFLAGLLGLAWLSTAWLSYVIFLGDFELLILKSAVYFRNVPGYQNVPYWVGDAPSKVSNLWWPQITQSQLSNPSSTTLKATVGVPLWMFMALPAAGWLFLFRRLNRRIPQGLCRVCRYNLTGNTSGVCPECGTPTLTAASG